MAAPPFSHGTAEASARAERHLRRGELVEAALLYEQLRRAHPHDARLVARAEEIRSQLQPLEQAELTRRLSGDVAAAPPAESSPVERAEALVTYGRLAEAVAAYRDELAADPANELLRERYDELRRQLSRGASAPAVPAPATSAVAGAPEALPADPVERARALLERVRQNRRTPQSYFTRLP